MKGLYSHRSKGNNACWIMEGRASADLHLQSRLCPDHFQKFPTDDVCSYDSTHSSPSTVVAKPVWKLILLIRQVSLL